MLEMGAENCDTASWLDEYLDISHVRQRCAIPGGGEAWKPTNPNSSSRPKLTSLNRVENEDRMILDCAKLISSFSPLHYFTTIRHSLAMRKKRKSTAAMGDSNG